MAEPARDHGASTDAARWARRLAWAGFIPFGVFSLWLYAIAADHPWRADTIFLLKTYAAIVISFLGGLAYGRAVSNGTSVARADLIAGVSAPLLGWGALFAPVPHAFALLAGIFAAQGAWDAYAVHRGDAPAWFGRLRIWLTLAVVVAMVMAMVATAPQPG